MRRLMAAAADGVGDGAVARRQLVVVDADEAVGGDGGHHRVDAAQRRRVRRWPSRRRRPPTAPGTRDRPHRRGAQLGPVAELDHGAGVQAARAGGDVLALLVATAGDVERPQPTGVPALVVATEDRHHAHAHHRRLEVGADHARELVRLALQAQRHALDLLVVLELELEELDHLHRRTGRAGDGDGAEAIGLDHLLHRAMADRVAGGGSTVTRHHHAAGEAHRHAGGGVGHGAGACRRRPWAVSTSAPSAAQQFREVRAGVVAWRKDGHPHDGLLTALLDVRLDEVLGVGLEHVVDLVEQVVELGLELLAANRSWSVPSSTASATSSERVVGFAFCVRSAIAAPPVARSDRSRSSRPQPIEQLDGGGALVDQPSHVLRGSAQWLHHRHPAAAVRARRRTPSSPSWRPRSASGYLARQRPRK